MNRIIPDRRGVSFPHQRFNLQDSTAIAETGKNERKLPLDFISKRDLLGAGNTKYEIFFANQSEVFGSKKAASFNKISQKPISSNFSAPQYRMRIKAKTVQCLTRPINPA